MARKAAPKKAAKKEKAPKRKYSRKAKAAGEVLVIGAKVFIRTVTNYFTGRIVNLVDHEVILEDCAWIAWTKRFADTLKEGTFDEVEPYPDGVLVSVNRDAIVDVCQWNHDLPRVQQ